MIKAKKSLGQHFLVDKNIARNIVNAVQPLKGDTILEIGPGTGILTEFLAASGANIVAVDVDPRAVEVLKQRAESEHWSNVGINHADILEYDLAEIGGADIKVVGNLPYNITSPILFRLFDAAEYVHSAVCMMQLEVARRICSGPGTKEYGILSVQSQAYTEPKLLFKVSPNVFAPKPDVWSAVVRFDFAVNRMDRIPSIAHFKRVVKAAFGVRRKTLQNALKQGGLLGGTIPEGLEPYLGKRAEQLSVDEFIELSSLLQVYDR